MKPIVYFAGAIRGDATAHTTIAQLITFIKNDLKLSVLTEHIADKNIVDAALTAEAIEQRDIEWLDTATHVIAEISGASTGTGREIEYARTKQAFGKTPATILCLYHKDREHYASPMIRGMDAQRYPNIQIKSYTSIEEALAMVKDFLQK